MLLGLVVLMPLLKGSAVPGHGEIWLGTSFHRKGRLGWAGPWEAKAAGALEAPGRWICLHPLTLWVSEVLSLLLGEG